MYNQLYKFDIKQELQDYNIPFSHNEESMNNNVTKQMAASKVSSMFEPSDVQSRSEEDIEEDTSDKPNYTEIAKGLYR